MQSVFVTMPNMTVWLTTNMVLTLFTVVSRGSYQQKIGTLYFDINL